MFYKSKHIITDNYYTYNQKSKILIGIGLRERFTEINFTKKILLYFHNTYKSYKAYIELQINIV